MSNFRRAFSTRKQRPDDIEISAPMFITRAASQRGGRPVQRMQISAPVNLQSTSNAQVNRCKTIFGAKSIDILQMPTSPTSPPPPMMPGATTGSEAEAEDSDASTAPNDSGSEEHDDGTETVTDASSVDDDSSPLRAEPEPNHLTSYFKPAVHTHAAPASELHSASASARPSLDVVPRLPERAPSHSKKAHEGLHRKRSIQRMLSPPPGARAALRDVARNSIEMFSPTKTGFFDSISSSSRPTSPTPRSPLAATMTTPLHAEPLSPAAPLPPASPRRATKNPFGAELAQLDAVAEEFGQVGQSAEAEADARVLEARGLAKCAAADYMLEIQSLIHRMFSDESIAVHAIGGFF